MTLRSALVVGATGLVGGELVRQLLADPEVGTVHAMVRREAGLGAGPKLATHKVDFEHLDPQHPGLEVTQVFCAMGTTIRKAGSQEAFRAVDYLYPLTVARLALARGASAFYLVSALGADARSRVFYNRVKGELEDAVRGLGYGSVTIARPSFLVGQRAEFRLGEAIGIPLGYLLPPRYRPVRAGQVAGALVAAAREQRPGVWIIENRDLRRPRN